MNDVLDLRIVSGVLLAWLGHALLFGTLLAGLTGLLVKLLRRHVPPAFVAALWCIVLVKFLVPIGPDWSLSLASAWETLSQRAPVALDAATSSDVDLESPIAANLGASKAGERRTVGAPSWVSGLMAAYLLSVVALMAVRIRAYRVFAARCRALSEPDEAAMRLVRDVCRRLGVRRVPAVRVSDEVPAPFVIGILHPLLVLSHRQFVRPDELETVIVHEVTHLRRGDLLVRTLQWIAGTLFFFWPVVAWVNRRIDAAREHACDEWALSHGKLSAGEYARCLLEAVQPRSVRSAVYQPSCMAGTLSTIERRIDVILATTNRPYRRRAWGLLTLAFLVSWGAFALTGAARADDPDDKKAPKWADTKEDVKQHANHLLKLATKRCSVADLDGDGFVSREESYPLFVFLAFQHEKKMLKKFPVTDSDGDGELSLVEAYDLIRGQHELTKANNTIKKAIQAAEENGELSDEKMKKYKVKGERLTMAAYHKTLDRREWLLANMEGDPPAKKLRAIGDRLRKIDAERKMKQAYGDKGEPSTKEKKAKIAELKAKIATLEEQGETEKAAKLRKKLKQLLSD